MRINALAVLGLKRKSAKHSGFGDNTHGTLAAVWSALDTGICSLEDLTDFSIQFSDVTTAAVMIKCIRDMHEAGALTFFIHSHGTFVAECRGNFLETVLVELNAQYQLSRHAYATVSAEANMICLKSAPSQDEVLMPLSVVKVVFDVIGVGGAGGQVIMDLLTSALSLESPAVAHTLLSVLSRAKIINLVDVSGSARRQQVWEFHDLLFHGHSTQKQASPAQHGATFRMGAPTNHPVESSCEAWPVITTLARADRVDFSISLWDVLQRRRSAPASAVGGAAGLTDLGKFLSGLAPGSRNSGRSGADQPRLYPGAGGCYELEFYVLGAESAGAQSGILYYDSSAHALRHVCDWSDQVSVLRSNACYATGRIVSPAFIILITARFARLAWKYEGIAYALCLKDVGVVFHHMYLMGAALNMEVCALGAVDAELFSNITGIDSLEQPLVGEFMIVGERILNDA